jgi:hypothetical protein
MVRVLVECRGGVVDRVTVGGESGDVHVCVWDWDEQKDGPGNPDFTKVVFSPTIPASFCVGLDDNKMDDYLQTLGGGA